MNKDWLELPLLVELTHLTVIDITGADAKSFLQDQVCNDLTTFSENELQINGYCNPKGRLLAVFTVYAHEDGYRLVLPEGIAEAFVKRLQMFVMRAQVSIRLCTELVCSGLIFADSSKTGSVELAENTLELPTTVLTLTKNQHMHVLRWHDAPIAFSSNAASQEVQNRYLCIAEPDVMSSLWESNTFSYQSSLYWRHGDINAGIPNVYTSSVEQFIPQMLNMQFIDALSFKKGCYPGQEIVARMQYLGKLKKHMKHMRIANATDAPAPGEVLTTDSNNNAGQVVDAVVDEGGLNLLAVVNIDTDVGELKLGDVGFVNAPLPYSVVSEDNRAT